MHNFKKALIASLCFLLCFAAMFAVVVYPAFGTDSVYNDSAKRRELAGSTDFLICGASHALGAFVPDIIDEELGCRSYNLSSYAASFDGKYWLIKKELERNPVDTFVLEISYDTLRDYSGDRSTGEPMTILKLDSFGERLRYMAKYVPITDLDKVGSVTLRYGLNAWKAKLSGQLNIPQSNRGYVPNTAKALHNDAQSILERAGSRSIEAFDPDSMEMVRRIAAVCREKGAEMIVVVVPVSERHILSYANLDEFRIALNEFCAELDVSCYDFNLLKNRGEIFSDEDCFFDSSHIGGVGAEKFSRVFSELMLAKAEGQDTEGRFFPDYAEAEKALMEKYK